MTRIRRALACRLTVLALLGVALPTAAIAAPVFEPKPCADAALAAVARCGVVAVPEDSSGVGRTIALNVVVLPGVAPAKGKPALFDLEGGPGLPSSKNAGFYLTDGVGYRRYRDVVLFDQRGTGASNPLLCPELQAAAGALEPMYPVEQVEACRARLSRTAHLEHYTTDDAARDIEAVRVALGYDRIDIVALSYGTTLALRYMALQPDRVHAAVLTGAVPPDAMPPRHHAEAAGRALTLLIADCARDAACSRAFPDLHGDLQRARDRLTSAGGPPTPDVFMEKVRTLMYSPASARRAPWLIHRAASGDFAWMKDERAAAQQNVFAEGLYLSITCAESMALMPYEDAAAAARSTPFGDYRLRRQREACRHWPVERVSGDSLRLTRSRAPVLIISGRRDPVAPVAWGEALARGLPNARQIVIEEGAHVVEGLSALDTCFDPVIQRFLETASLKALDDSCFGAMRAPPFKVADDR
jgi:pimeloyl-ACP methyl ester carboxylesterase